MNIKKIIILSLITLIFGFSSVNAAIVCEYEHSKDSSKKLEVQILGEEYVFKLNNSIIDLKPYTKFEKCPQNIYFNANYVENNILYRNKDFSEGKVNASLQQYLQGYRLVESYSIENDKVSCGTVTDIPKKFPELTSMFMTIIQIAVPVVLVIMGSLDLFKGIIAQKEDEIKKGQNILVKRLIVAAMVFFVFAITKILVSFIADSTEESNDIVECMDCFLSGSEHCKIQFKEV